MICSFTYFATSWVNSTYTINFRITAWLAESSTHLWEVCQPAAIDGPRSAAIKLDQTPPTCRDFRLARRGFGRLYETSEVEVRAQVRWDG